MFSEQRGLGEFTVTDIGRYNYEWAFYGYFQLFVSSLCIAIVLYILPFVLFKMSLTTCRDNFFLKNASSGGSRPSAKEGARLTMNVEFCEDNFGTSKKMRYFRKNKVGARAPRAPPLDPPLVRTFQTCPYLPIGTKSVNGRYINYLALSLNV